MFINDFIELDSALHSVTPLERKRKLRVISLKERAIKRLVIKKLINLVLEEK